VNDTNVERISTIPPGILIAATALCGVLSGLVWHSRGPARWEQTFISLLQHEPLPMARPLVLLWQPLPFAVATVWLAGKAMQSDRVRLALSGMLGSAAAMIVTERVLKPLIGRHHLYSGSAVFPSGHVTAAAAWAMFAWLVIDPRSRFRSALPLVPIVAAWAVVSTGVHYPADAIAGGLIGGLIVYGVVVIADQLTAVMTLRLLQVPAAAPISA
jgi:membrane-associated phospholipid phosphatase